MQTQTEKKLAVVSPWMLTDLFIKVDSIIKWLIWKLIIWEEGLTLRNALSSELSLLAI